MTAITIGIGGINSTVISCSLDCTCKFWSLMHGTHLNTVTFPCAVWGIVMDTMESEFYAAGDHVFRTLVGYGLHVKSDFFFNFKSLEIWVSIRVRVTKWIKCR